MTPPNVLTGWSSSQTASRVAAEIQGPLGAEALLTALPQAAPWLRHAGFLLVGVSRISSRDAALAHAAFVRAGGTARICLAVRRDALEDLADVDAEHIGLMLDEVNMQTSCADLVREGLEAVRFSAAFVTQAAGDMRAACALSAMHGLARDLGLTTFGPVAVTAAFELERLPFDYVPAINFAEASASREARAAPSLIRSA